MSKLPKSSKRGRPRTFDREHALDVAIDSYWREGPLGMSLNEVCRRAGVSKPGLYREFGNEDGLMVAVLARYAERVAQPIVLGLEEEKPFQEIFDWVLAFMTDRPEGAPAGCLIAKLRASPSLLGPNTLERLESLREMMVDAYTRWFSKAQIRSEVTPDLDALVAGRYIDAQFTNILAQMTAGEDPQMVRTQAKLAFACLVN